MPQEARKDHTLRNLFGLVTTVAVAAVLDGQFGVFGHHIVSSAEASALLPLDDHRFVLPDIPGLEAATPLADGNFDAKIADVAMREEHARNFLTILERIAPPDDPDLKHLHEVYNYYHSMHQQLEELRTRVHELTTQREHLPADKQFRVQNAEYKLRLALSKIQSPEGLSLARADVARVEAEYLAAYDFFHTATPGSVMYTDPKTNERFWYPLSGGPDPRPGHVGERLPALIQFGPKVGTELPLSTARTLYEFQQQLDERLQVQGVGIPIKSSMASVTATEGYKDKPGSGLTWKHASDGHHDGRFVDLHANDKTPYGIAKWLAASQHVEHGKLFFEFKNISEAKLASMQNQIADELHKFGYSDAEADKIAHNQVRIIYWGSADHYHYETDGPIVKAEPPVHFAKR